LNYSLKILLLQKNTIVLGEFQMSQSSAFLSTLRIGGPALVLLLMSLLWTENANAGNPLQCKGPTKGSVISCCQREIEGNRPSWMTSGNLSCKEAATCGGMKSKERCKIEILVLQNPTHQTQDNRQKDTSDIRLKTNIHRVGTTVFNLPLYSFEYKAKHGTYIGVMAQDVLKVKPAAVSVGRDGFYRVDYQKLGIEMLQVQ
jgi:hypothetical protein